MQCIRTRVSVSVARSTPFFSLSLSLSLSLPALAGARYGSRDKKIGVLLLFKMGIPDLTGIQGPFLNLFFPPFFQLGHRCKTRQHLTALNISCLFQIIVLCRPSSLYFYFFCF